MNRFICIHGHFYQPPRENPWLEDIERQDSAYPYHDWNQRITAECYGPNTCSRILNSDEKIVNIVNNYSRISFNFGPTLLSWMQAKEPEVYKAILAADQESRRNFSGHGSALAQCYNHMIMPLANARDKRTQVIWGLADFEHRFGRRPEGMWLPETAVDLHTLDILAEHGIKFTILAPRQAKHIRRIGEKAWRNAADERVNPMRPYLCHLPSGRTISLFFYDGPISRDVAFEGLLRNGEHFAKRLLSVFGGRERQLVHIATDGETYGHHHPHGDMALAYCLSYIQENRLASLTVYGEYLAENAPLYEAEIHENSSWSCAHGIERWRSNCGCHIGAGPGWTQMWRGGLREAMDWLRDALIPLYEAHGRDLFRDPWAARDEYIDVVLDRSRDNVERFLVRSAARHLTAEDKVRALKLLEMQRNAMLMYTSCGWFFDEVSGIETVQIMQYAGRAMQLARETAGADFEPGYMERLAGTPSNIPALENAAGVYDRYVRPSQADALRIGAHFAVCSLFDPKGLTDGIYCYSIRRNFYKKDVNGQTRCATGQAVIVSDITREENAVDFAVWHQGGHRLLIGVRSSGDDERTFLKAAHEIGQLFAAQDETALQAKFRDTFGERLFTLQHLLKDQQGRVLLGVLDTNLEKVEGAFQQIRDHYEPILQVINELHIPLPKLLADTAAVMLNRDFLETFSSEEIDMDRLRKLVGNVRQWPLEIDKVAVSHMVRKRVIVFMEDLRRNPHDTGLFRLLRDILAAIEPLDLNIDFWKAQNLLFSVGQEQYFRMGQRALKGDERAQEWCETFTRLSDDLSMRVDHSEDPALPRLSRKFLPVYPWPTARFFAKRR